jgi:hypothetical protein
MLKQGQLFTLRGLINKKGHSYIKINHEVHEQLVYRTSRIEGSRPAKKIRRNVKGESVNTLHECDVEKMYAVCHVS